MKKKPIYFWSISVLLIVFFASTWVFQINNLAKLSDAVASAQRDVAELSAENNLLASGTLLREAQGLEKVAQNFNFHKIETVKYIQASEPTVLAR